MNKLISRINSSLAACFYLIFFVTPLLMYSNSHEIFEFNKMWFIFGVSAVIFYLWITKMIILKKFIFTRTPMDIPIALFVISQIVSTIISLDSYVSFWGYYSRFNGGLLSTITYVFLYYALTSNLLGNRTHESSQINFLKTVKFRLSDIVTKKIIQNFFSSENFSYKLILISITSGVLVALWGLPSHFGYDPTCLLFRGELNSSCWTEAFQPTIRIFSTLGQPNWLAAYLSILLLPLVGLFISTFQNNKDSFFGMTGQIKTPENLDSGKFYSSKNLNFQKMLLGVLILLFYLSLIWTKSQSGFLGFWTGFGGLFFIISLYIIKDNLKKNIHTASTSNFTAKVLSFIFFLRFLKYRLTKILFMTGLMLLVLNFLFGFPIERLNKFTFNQLTKQSAQQTPQSTETAISNIGGTNSGKIRLIVWRGAWDIFKKNPLVGSGVETFAFSYFQNRPIEHNNTSEWDFLYNKAHNEYLNYAATTGIFGLGSYLAIIIWFLWTSIKYITSNNYYLASKTSKSIVIDNRSLIIASALIASYISILVSNFFGFSVVLVNLFFFLIPALTLDIFGKIAHTKENELIDKKISKGKLLLLILPAILFLYWELTLVKYWIADKSFALGYNYNRTEEPFNATNPLIKATKLRPNEPLYLDELAANLGTLAYFAKQQNQSTQAAELASQAAALSDAVIKKHPNNVTFYKSRTRILYTISDINPQYLDQAIKSLEAAQVLSPTDPKIPYNLSLLYIEINQTDRAIQLLKNSIKLKKDYPDPYYTLALIYSKRAKENTPQANTYKIQATDLLRYYLKNIVPQDKKALQLLNSL